MSPPAAANLRGKTRVRNWATKAPLRAGLEVDGVRHLKSPVSPSNPMHNAAFGSADSLSLAKRPANAGLFFVPDHATGGCPSGSRTSLVHRVLRPQMYGRVASPLLGRGAGGRSPGYLIPRGVAVLSVIAVAAVPLGAQQLGEFGPSSYDRISQGRQARPDEVIEWKGEARRGSDGRQCF
jgi:hypothetical protein